VTNESQNENKKGNKQEKEKGKEYATDVVGITIIIMKKTTDQPTIYPRINRTHHPR
jgi:hypothetical protein